MNPPELIKTVFMPGGNYFFLGGNNATRKILKSKAMNLKNCQILLFLKNSVLLVGFISLLNCILFHSYYILFYSGIILQPGFAFILYMNIVCKDLFIQAPARPTSRRLLLNPCLFPDIFHSQE